MVARAMLVAAVVYLLLPFDFFPDALPFLGQVDDLAVFLLACKAFLYLCPRAVVKEHVEKIGRADWT